jgi:WD40 repeat protein
LKLLTAHNNSRICIWDAESMKLDKSIPLINGSVCITSVIVDREWSTFCAISDSDNKSSGILCYDLIRNEERRRFVCDALPVRMVYSNNDCYLIAGYNDGCIRKWNINTGQMHTVFRSGWSEETECGCGVM